MQISGNRKWILLAVLALAAVGIAFVSLTNDSSKPERTDLTKLLSQIRSGDVAEVTVDSDGRALDVVMENGTEHSSMLPANQSLTSLLNEAGVPSEQWPTIYFAEESQGIADNLGFILRLGLIAGVFVLVIFLMRRMMPGAFGNSGKKNRFTPVAAGESGLSFDDVAGSAEIKHEVSDIVDFLKEPERFRAVGAQIPRGLLLVGPPGTGKTLLAKALAGEANANFFSVSGAEFVELYVGVGASRVRDLFRKAKEVQPSIVFIDEIDAIGRRRGRADNSSEYDQTLNQILVEMDGFEQRSNVVVIAATNRVDVLDSALLRPGRFDRKVHVELPDREARRAILAVHSRGKPVAEDVDLDEISARTAGLTGADLANVVNEAAILAARSSQPSITMLNFIEALERTLAGPARAGRRFSMHERRVVAYHEAGHALVTYLLPHADTVRKVSIVARGQAGGFTMITPEEDRGLWTRTQLEQRLAGLLAGMAAEEIIFEEVTTGSSNDLEQATNIASSMVQRYGMGRTFGLLSAGSGAGMSPPFSPQSTYAAEQEALSIVSDAHRLARSIIDRHRDDLEGMAQRLMEVETIEGSELLELISATPETVELGSEVYAPNDVTVPPVNEAEPVPRSAPRRQSRARRLAGVAVAAFSVVGKLLVRETAETTSTSQRTHNDATLR